MILSKQAWVERSDEAEELGNLTLANCIRRNKYLKLSFSLYNFIYSEDAIGASYGDGFSIKCSLFPIDEDTLGMYRGDRDQLGGIYTSGIYIGNGNNIGFGHGDFSMSHWSAGKPVNRNQSGNDLGN